MYNSEQAGQGPSFSGADLTRQPQAHHHLVTQAPQPSCPPNQSHSEHVNVDSRGLSSRHHSGMHLYCSLTSLPNFLSLVPVLCVSDIFCSGERVISCDSSIWAMCPVELAVFCTGVALTAGILWVSTRSRPEPQPD